MLQCLMIFRNFASKSVNLMEQYIVSARKYRPSSFKTVVGQKSLTATLKNAIDSDRLAQAYLFCGPRGVGKTSCARIFAKTINCLSPTADGEACNECESCRAFNEGRSYNIVELDAASNNSVEDIRNLTDQVRIPPQVGSYRVFIIDEVHMLSIAAFNAFLKTLEEPPSYVVFILATTEKHKVIPTILSRCQIYDFNRITINDMVEHLAYVASEEGITAETAALNVIAQKADGAMRDALSIFDQVAASSMGHITYKSAIANLNVLDYEYYFRLVDAFLEANVVESLLIYKQIRDAGFDSLFFINGLANHIRDLMVSADPRTLPLLEVSSEVGTRYVEQAKKIKANWYYAAMEYCNSCDLNYRTSSNKQFLVELTLIRLCQLVSGGTAILSTDTGKPMAPVKSQEPPVQQQPQTPQAKATQPVPASTNATILPNLTGMPQRRVVTPPPAPQTSIRQPRQSPMSISAAKQELNKSDVAAKVMRNKSIEEESLRDLWFQFIFKHKELRIAVNAMRNAIPESVGDGVYKIIVENPSQKQAIESSMTTILSFMRDGLENDYFSLNVEVNDSFERVKLLSPVEVIQKIMTNNPVLADGLRKLKAEMM